VAAALSVQLLDAMLQPTYDSQDSTTALFASDDAVSFPVSSRDLNVIRNA
jgi:hypothetical protein